MSVEGQPKNRLQAYLKQLTPQARSRLLSELERLHLSGEEIPGSGGLLAVLRAEFRRGAQAAHERADDPTRYFFQPLEPVLTKASAADAHAGQISRMSLPAIWDWIEQLLLPAMTGEYEQKIKPLIAASRKQEAEQVAGVFRFKVEKCLEGIFADQAGAERTRRELAKFTTSAAVVGDIEKILHVFRSKDALAEFHASLPKQIEQLKGRVLSELHQRLETLGERHAEALPFALYMMSRRLKEPWQLIRLVVHAARGKVDVAATPYAVAFAIVLGPLNELRMKLLEALRHNHALAARGILAAIYDFEYELRTRIAHLGQAEWERRLDQLMAKIGNDLEMELQKLPSNLQHVLDTRSLQRSDGLMGRLRQQILRLRESDLPAELVQRAQALLSGGAVRR